MIVNRNNADRRNSSQLWEYVLAAYPDETILRLVREEQSLFPGAYASAPGLKPHICVATFQAKEELEETLVRWLQNICRLHPAFGVTLNNFGGLPPHTLYLRVQDHQPFLQLGHRLRIIDGFIQSNDCPPIRLNARPIMAIASLPEAAYSQALVEFSRRSFHAEFRVDKLVLARRWWEGGAFELVNTFNLPRPD